MTTTSKTEVITRKISKYRPKVTDFAFVNGHLVPRHLLGGNCKPLKKIECIYAE